MAEISNPEFLTMVEGLRTLVGQRFQSVIESEGNFVFQFWSGDESLVGDWTLSLKPRQAYFLPRPKGIPLKKDHRKTPCGFFIKAHFCGLTLQAVEWRPEFGRVVKLHFGQSQRMEIRLFPGGENLILTAAEKGISLRKPKELKPLAWSEGEKEGRSLEQLAFVFHQPRSSPHQQKDPENLRAEKLAKLEKAKQRTLADVQDKESQLWPVVGEWLKQYQTMSVPSEFEALIDRNLSLYENINRLFEKAKDMRSRIERSRLRIREIDDEILRLKSASPDQVLGLADPSQGSSKGTAKSKSKIGLPRFSLADGIELYVGRSALENLKILRGASPWDLWLHLRDFPSAHAVLRRNKGIEPSDAVFREVLNLFVRQSFKAKSDDRVGEVFDVLLAEVRFVRPIKGDRLGRVTYSNERVLRHRFERPKAKLS